MLSLSNPILLKYQRKEIKMIVLGIILGIVIMIVIAILIEKLDTMVSQNYGGYKFFTIGNFITVFVGYVLIYFGHSWFVKAVAKSGDSLNGIVLICIGLFLVLVVVVKNITNTSFILGFTVSIFQLALFAFGSVFAFFALLMAIAFFAETKPVYNIND